MWGTFHNKSGVIVSWENVWMNVQSLVTKRPILVSKRNSIEKETSEIFDCNQLSFLQRLICTIRLFRGCFLR